MTILRILSKLNKKDLAEISNTLRDFKATTSAH